MVMTAYIISVTALASLSLLAADFGVPSAYISARFGHVWSLTLGMLLTVLSYLLLWSSLFNISFYKEHYYLLVVYFIMVGKYTFFINTLDHN